MGEIKTSVLNMLKVPLSYVAGDVKVSDLSYQGTFCISVSSAGPCDARVPPGGRASGNALGSSLLSTPAAWSSSRAPTTG